MAEVGEISFIQVDRQGQPYLRGTSTSLRDTPVWIEVWLKDEASETLEKAKDEVDKLLEHYFGKFRG